MLLHHCQIEVVEDGVTKKKNVQFNYQWQLFSPQVDMGLVADDFFNENNPNKGNSKMRQKIALWLSNTKGAAWGGLIWRQSRCYDHVKEGQAYGYCYSAKSWLLKSVVEAGTHVQMETLFQDLLQPEREAVPDELVERQLYFKVQPWHTTCKVDVYIGGSPADWVAHFLTLGFTPQMFPCSQDQDDSRLMMECIARRCVSQMALS